MSEKIGYQDGITAFFDWYRKQPNVPQRGPNYDPDNIDTWPWPDKMERTMRILKDDHDAAVANPPQPGPEPEPEPEPEPGKYAPRTYNTTSRADARFCMKEEYGVTRQGAGYVDQMGATYDESGRDLGARSKDIVPGLKGADSMDGREPCDPYTQDGKTFPPYPAESFNK
jgi:hypothetical protein